MNPIPKLTISVTKTADGQHEYVQILSGDQFSLNIVLIANQIVVEDSRSQRQAMTPKVAPR